MVLGVVASLALNVFYAVILGMRVVLIMFPNLQKMIFCIDFKEKGLINLAWISDLF